MFAAGSFYVAPESPSVSNEFIVYQHDRSDVLALDVVGLIPVDVADGVTNYTVQRGDSLSRIATQFGTTITHLKDINGLTTNNLRVGQELFITESQGIIHIAKSNSNFLIFANKYNLDLEDVMTLNYVTSEDAPIMEGDQLFLPITIEKAYAL
jgi:LysM repeat protein